MIKKILFILFWFAVVPAAVSRIATVITSETITDRPRAYVEARWGGSPFDYLIHCPVCTSHWIAGGFILATIPLWNAIYKTLSCPWYTATAMMMAVWTATIEAAIKWWKF